VVVEIKTLNFVILEAMKSYGKHRQNNYNRRAILLENICIDVHEQYKRGAPWCLLLSADWF